MSNTKPRTIAFISGKGGSGKTTVAIATAKLLADMEHPCLLVDFDLATNGASYFFKDRFDRESEGIWESLTKRESGLRYIVSLFNIPLQDMTIHELDNHVSSGIFGAFSENGISLSANTTISTERSEREWTIIDGRKKYYIRKTLTSLGVYENPILKRHTIEISKDFYFVPSRTNLNVKGESYDSIVYNEKRLQRDLIEPLIEYATQTGAHYILIDCQAGYSLAAIAATENADMAVIVSEADSISSDAADNLLVQLGSALPTERRYLINKIDVRDADTYRAMRNVFQSLNRLPPLPFDFDVRNAFGARQIPVNLASPSPFLFALFETVKYMFTEIFEDIDSYKREHVDSLFTDYDQRLQRLLEQKEELEQEQAEIKTHNIRSRYRVIQTASLFISTVMLIIGILYVVEPFVNLYIPDSVLSGSLVLFAGMAMAYISSLWLRQYRKGEGDEKREAELSRTLEVINREIDQFRSFLWARSRDFLVDTEITSRMTVVSDRQEEG